jgi:tight adherence protein B
VIPLYAIIVFAVLFAVVMVAISLGYRFIESERKKRVEGMLQAVSGEETAEPSPAILREPDADDPLQELLRKAAATTRLERLIQQSGVDWTVTRWVVLTLILALAGALLGALLRPLGSPLAGILVGTFLLGMIPTLYLKFKRSRRLAELESQLPEALDFLARSMRAGHAFSISLEMLGQESPEPIGQEFRVLFNEQNLGAPLETCLNNFYQRIPLLDVQLFVSSVMLQRQTGGNLSEILLRLAHVIRERFRLRGQVRAASAHGRLTAAVLSIMPVVLMFALFVIAPGYLQSMAQDTTGKWMIVGAIIGQFLGYMAMRKIVNIKV